MLKKIFKKKVVIIIIIVAVLGFIGHRIFIKDGEPEYILERVSMGTVIKEVSETGAVKISEETNLSFKNSGRIDKIYVKVGDQIKKGQKLAQLDTSQLYIELSEARAALEVAQADYNKLLAGSSDEEIKVAEAEVYNTQITLDNYEQTLEDVRIDAKEDLDQAYQNTLIALDDAYLKIYNSFNTISDLQRTYFSGSDQEGAVVRENKDIIENSLGEADLYIDDAKDGSHDKIDTALLKVGEILEDVKDALEQIRNMTETANYRDSVSSSDKTSLDNHKSYINTEISDIIAAKQDISLTEITNETNINDAQADVSLAEAKLQKAQDELALKKAGPTQENINLYSAKIKQAEANVSLLQNKISGSILRSPDNGQITEINKRQGETVQSTDSVLSFLPAGPFQVEVDIYEEDIIDVKEGNLVRIILPAFPDEVLNGRVISIDPAEKLIDGVVYYEVNISIDEEKENIKPGMTADIIIEIDKKENVLVVSKQAVKKINGEKIVRVFKDEEIEERKIETGLEDDEYIEIISGLSEGEDIIIAEKP